MIPILYSKNETNFNNNGIGFLTDAISCEVKEARNGEYELTLQYPITGKWYSEITDSAIIKAKANETSTLQLFRIYKSSKPLKGVVTYSAEHISYDLCGIPTLGLEVKNATAQRAMTEAFDNAAFNCPFTATSDISTLNSTSILTACSLRSILGGQKGSILDTWGGEFEFDNFTVRLHEHRGADNGVTIEYGKNLTDIKQESNITDTYTHILPYAVYSEETEGDGEAVEQYIYLPEKVMPLINASAIGHYKAFIVDLSDAFAENETITEATLREKATEYAATAQIGVPKVNITVSFVQLWQTEEYKNIAPLERVRLCDIVTVKFSKLGIIATAKVIETNYNTLEEKYGSIKLGDAKSSFADSANKQAADLAELTQSVIKGQSQAAEALKKAIANATSLITGHSGGYVVLNPAEKPQEILILDKPTIEEAVRVWRWNSGGLGYSSTGYDGEYALAMTMDGAIVADFITAGTINGILLKADSVQASAISVAYKQEVADSIGNVESSVTQAFKVADEELLSTINIKLNDYATSEEMSSAITQKANEISLTVTEARTYAEGLASAAQSNAEDYTDQALTAYPTSEEMSSAITQKANEISLTVTEARTYAEGLASAAQSNAEDYTDQALTAYPTSEEMSSAITQKANEISLTVTEARTYAEGLASAAQSNAEDYTDEALTAYPTSEEMSSAITLATDGISLVVTKTADGNEVNTASIVAAINDDSSVTINANRINLTAYAKSSEVYDIAEGAAEDTIYGITLTATNDSDSSTVRIKHNGVTISSATVSFTGIVTFSDLETEGATTINGSNITTGTLSADLIAANNGVYIEFAHPIMTSDVSGLEVIYFGEYAYIHKEDYDANTTSALWIYAYGGVVFNGSRPVYHSYEYKNGRWGYYDYNLLHEGDEVVAVFG